MTKKYWLVLALGWIAFLVYAYPGLMTRDSYDQLIEARNGILYDAHPPMMQAIWRVLDYFVAGPFGMIVLQTGTFTAGCYLIVRRALSPRAAAITAAALLWFPPIGAVMAVVWKDCLMAGLLMLGIGLLLGEGRRAKVAGVALLGVATATRYNAFGATLVPIVLWFTWSDRFVGIRRYALAFAVWIVVTLVAFRANALLTDRPTHYWHASLGVNDIVGTLAFVPRDIEDRKLRRALAGTPLVVQHGIHAHIRAHYKPDEHVWTVAGADRMFDMSLVESAPPDQRAAVERAWKTIIKGHPIAYARYRFDVLGCVLGLYGESWDRKLIVTHDYQNANELRELGIPVGYSALQDAIGRIYESCSTTLLFRPYFYLAIAVALIGLGRRQRDVLALLGSGLFVEASLLPIAPSSDYRYSHWFVVTTCIALVLVTVRRYRERHG